MAETNKQEQVINLVKEGQHTREQIIEQVKCTVGSMASYLSTMTNIARFGGAMLCPTTDEKGVMSVTSWEEAEAAKAAKASTRKTTSSKTPAERLEAAEKRVTRTHNACDSAKERYENNEDSRELELRFQLAEINMELADIELVRCQALVDESPAEGAEEEPEVTGDDLL